MFIKDYLIIKFTPKEIKGSVWLDMEVEVRVQ